MNKHFRILISLPFAYLFLRAGYDFYLLPAHEMWSEKYRPYWIIGLAGFCILLAGLIAYAVILYLRPGWAHRIENTIIQLRERLGLLRWPIALFILPLPILLILYSTPGFVFDGYILRLFIGLMTGLLMGVLLTRSETELVKPRTFIFSLLLFGSGFVITSYLIYVNNYPFSLSWSEGNRLYDYSVILGSNRYQYQGELSIPYDAPGRYLLWGILFLFENTPIWLHRLWDAVLWTALPILFGWSIARLCQFDRMTQISIALWIFLFIYQGPVYPTLILSAIIVALLVPRKYLALPVIGVAMASYYASISRWTWMFAPAIWAVLILLSRLEIKPEDNWKSILRRLIPVGMVALVGLAAGYFGKSDIFNVEELSSSTTFDQPLLWYRLFPNATYSAGIMGGLLLATGPLVAWMAWGVISRWWRLHWIQGLVYFMAVMATLVVGLVISVKIGGGNNLHNTDMYLVTLVILTGVMLQGRMDIPWKGWPALVQILLGLVLVLPVASAIRVGGPFRLPPADVVAQGLERIRNEVIKADAQGEVLFMDQRQLLTFGYIQDIPLVSEYEKKYNMDMAMANNLAYFKDFYADLSKQRFKLIISNPLRVIEKSQVDNFGDENNSWVEWVAKPVLCYYEPIETMKAIRVQLLVPRSNPVNCP